MNTGRLTLLVVALSLLVLLIAPAPSARAAGPTPIGWLDVSTWQAAADGSVTPLDGVSVLLIAGDGTQIAAAVTNAAGIAHLDAAVGVYTVISYRDGEEAAGRLSCDVAAWDYSGQAPWNGYNAEQETGVQIAPGAGLCRSYLFHESPPPAPPLPPAVHPVHITFDDGYIGLCATVDLVIRLDIRATFFLTGQAMFANPACVRRLIDAGDQLGNHTYAHEDLTRLSAAQISATLQRTEDTARAVGGPTTRPLCRPPYGAINAAVQEAAAQWGCQMLLWDRDTRDWAGVPIASIINTALSVSCRGETILMHTQAIGLEQYALPEIVSALRDRGCEPALY